MVAPRFLLILVNCLLIFVLSPNAMAAKHTHHKQHHRAHHARAVHHKKSRHHHNVKSAPAAAAKQAEVDTSSKVADASDYSADAALGPAIASESSTAINPKVLDMAMHAVHKADAQGIHHRNIMAIIDYSLASTQKRLWIIDLQAKHVLYNTLVAHGKTTGDNLAEHFSNQPGSQASSIGLFLTKDTYQGHNGKSLRLEGLEPGFNSNALSRAIVIHGANYVSTGFARSHGRLGRSWGCPAVPAQLSRTTSPASTLTTCSSTRVPTWHSRVPSTTLSLPSMPATRRAQSTSALGRS